MRVREFAPGRSGVSVGRLQSHVHVRIICWHCHIPHHTQCVCGGTQLANGGAVCAALWPVGEGGKVICISACGLGGALGALCALWLMLAVILASAAQSVCLSVCSNHEDKIPKS